MHRNAIPWIVVLAAATFGCAQPPAEQIDAASQAMDVAQSAQAPEYAPEAWADAQAAEAELEAELAVQKDAFVLTRSYDRAKSLAEDTRAKAENATEQAHTGKETARQDASRAIEEARALRETVDQMIATAPRGKGSVADLAALRADAKSTEEWLAEADAAFADERYLDALAKARSAIDSLNDVKSQIEAAKQARDGRA